jgi:hypothetical protein
MMGSEAPFAMTVLDFERSNEATWTELERAVSREDRALDPERFLLLYRAACEHLAMAEARGFPAPLVARLSALTARAHQIVYRRTDLGVGRIAFTLMHAFPARVRAHRGYVVAATSIMIVPAVTLGCAVAHWRLAAPAIMFLAAALALLILRHLPRFGPPMPPADTVRRSVAEQIRAHARFAWRTRRLASLRAAIRRALDDAARKQIAGYALMDSRRQAEALAAGTGIDANMIGAALASDPSCGLGEHRAAITLLEACRRILVGSPLPQRRRA